MSSLEAIRIGATLSLTGRYALQGGQAEAGLRLWAGEANAAGGLMAGPGGRRPVALTILDDGSHGDDMEANLGRLATADRADVLFGPYGSDLALRAVRYVASRGQVLWNHGGASDAVTDVAPAHVVSGIAPASSYFAALPALLRARDVAFDRLAILRSAPGTFGPHVAAGARVAAEQAALREVATFTFSPPLADRAEVLAAVRAWRPRAVLCAGRFADDVWLAVHRAALGEGLEMLAAAGSGLTAFGQAAGSAAEGVLGPSHWELPGDAPCGTGAAGAAFAESFARRCGRPPEYPAALAYAMGTVLAVCAAHAGTLDGAALRRAALANAVPTICGCFRLDPVTGRQIGYRPALVAWRGGRKTILAPAP
jgi:ABC-type branched-subunit amino acid transport system substrate-binding protein